MCNHCGWGEGDENGNTQSPQGSKSSGMEESHSPLAWLFFNCWNPLWARREFFPGVVWPTDVIHNLPGPYLDHA